jgi:hypothetical protein
MATAEKKTVTQEAFTVVLDAEEAEFLHDLLYRHVDGAGPRKYSDSISSALRGAGVNMEAFIGLGSGTVTYKDFPELADEPLKVGDIVKAFGTSLVGVDVDQQTGKLLDIDSGDRWPYYVDFGDRCRWVESVERVTD